MMKKILAAAALSTLAFSSAAVASESGVYGAFDLGQSKAADFCTGTPAGVSCTDTAMAFRIAGGVQMNKNFAIEANYMDSGKATASGFGITVDGRVTGLGVAAVGSLPLGDAFALTGKIGVESMSVKATGAGFGVAVSRSASNTNATFGVGMKYNLTPSVALRAQYEDFGTVGDVATTGTIKLTLLSAGLVFSF
jgi:OOP family OmpA-OmpF porin